MSCIVGEVHAIRYDCFVMKMSLVWITIYIRSSPFPLIQLEHIHRQWLYGFNMGAHWTSHRLQTESTQGNKNHKMKYRLYGKMARTLWMQSTLWFTNKILDSFMLSLSYSFTSSSIYFFVVIRTNKQTDMMKTENWHSIQWGDRENFHLFEQPNNKTSSKKKNILHRRSRVDWIFVFCHST